MGRIYKPGLVGGHPNAGSRSREYQTAIPEAITVAALSGVICETRAVAGEVIPAEAGIYSVSPWKCRTDGLHSRFRGNDRCPRRIGFQMTPPVAGRKAGSKQGAAARFDEKAPRKNGFLAELTLAGRTHRQTLGIGKRLIVIKGSAELFSNSAALPDFHIKSG